MVFDLPEEQSRAAKFHRDTFLLRFFLPFLLLGGLIWCFGDISVDQVPNGVLCAKGTPILEL